MSYFDMLMTAENLADNIDTDRVYFNDRGVSDIEINAFINLVNESKVVPADEEYSGLVMIAVTHKNNLKKTITKDIKKAAGYADQKYGINSNEYKRLQISSIYNSTDNNFIINASEILRILQIYLPDLTDIGLTQSFLDSIASKLELFETKVDAAADAKALRASKTIERKEKINELYSYCIKYAKIGRLIWEDINPSRYKLYVIYKNREKKKKNEEETG